MKWNAAREHLTHPKYRPDIDGLRALAVLAVLGFHAFPRWVRGGFVGVDVFFVISGFLISTIIFDNLESHSFSFAEFYARRMRRIFPALLIVLSGSLLIGWAVLLPDEFRQLCKHIFGGAGFVSNLILWNEVGYFDNAAITKPLIHLWSLGIEEQFYLLWPVLLWISWKQKWNPLLAISVIAGMSFALNIFDIQRQPSDAFYLPQARFWELLIGAALARIQLHKREFPLRDALSASGLVLIIASIVFISDGPLYPGWRALLPTVGAALIVATPQTWVNRHVLANPAVVWIGSISYPLYLWHWPLLSFARIVDVHEPRALVRLAILCVAVLLAWATAALIERPIRFGKNGGLKVAALTTATVIITMITSAGYWQIGLEPRLNSGIVGIEAAVNNATNRYAALHVRADANCKEILKGSTDQLYCQLASRTPTMLIVGDSHAIAFGQSQVRVQNPDVAVVASYGCLPLISYATTDLNRSIADQETNCHRLMDATTYLAKALPTIKSVILVGRGGYTFRVNRFRDGADEDPDRSFVDGYAETIAAFQALNKKVVFVSDVPDIGMDPTACIDIRSVRLGLHAATHPHCTVPIDAVRAHQRHYKELVSSVLTDTTGVDVFDTDDVLCDASRCYGGRNDVIYYYDENHLSEAGSEMVFTAFARWMDRP